jgi:hypothetical protein
MASPQPRPQLARAAHPHSAHEPCLHTSSFSSCLPTHSLPIPLPLFTIMSSRRPLPPQEPSAGRGGQDSGRHDADLRRGNPGELSFTPACLSLPSHCHQRAQPHPPSLKSVTPPFRQLSLPLSLRIFSFPSSHTSTSPLPPSQPPTHSPPTARTLSAPISFPLLSLLPQQDVLDSDDAVKKLQKVPGIGPKKSYAIKKEWDDHTSAWG